MKYNRPARIERIGKPLPLAAQVGETTWIQIQWKFMVIFAEEMTVAQAICAVAAVDRP